MLNRSELTEIDGQLYHLGRPVYIYIYGMSETGRPVVLSAISEREAKSLNSGKLNGEGKLFYFYTRDFATAKSMIKAALLRESESGLSEVLRPMYSK